MKTTTTFNHFCDLTVWYNNPGRESPFEAVSNRPGNSQTLPTSGIGAPPGKKSRLLLKQKASILISNRTETEVDL
jgi:hypothetical protein